ncbi:hypothetical protein E6C76_05475 [Pseudothauera nasutitermitis]|uniref:Uncharacterized protein n=1 Tax=Pseudothauera nasutitermitis TaxID=2565930 RepID=A0A4S4B1A8_9RHOO|nr:hypothetical protein [Pseudothauera nasutitermitis]THF66293.1 hypothetical protein E6C76_05475 [Pseudothauera nasutitermitis]
MTNPNNGDYRAWQTVTAAATGALLYPLAGRSVWIDSALGATSAGVVTAVTNEVYDRPNTGSNSVVWNAFLGGTFGYLGNRVADGTTNYLNANIPRYIGGKPIDRNVPILLQNLGRPNPLVPYIDTIGKSTGNVVNGIPSLAPGLFSGPSQGENP